MSKSSDRSQSELILNPDGSVYHLNLLPEDVAPLVILVGDPERVDRVSKHFDEVVIRKAKREFITHTGRIGKTPITVISSGIGTDNIDIVINEIDALFNVNLSTRLSKPNLTQLTFVRIGTSGAIQYEIPVDTFVVSRYALGLDAFARLNVQDTDEFSQQWFDKLLVVTQARNVTLLPAYIARPDDTLVTMLGDVGSQWLTVTCAGFYGLQGRSIRLQSNANELFTLLGAYECAGIRAGNLEMETSGIYLLARMLGHRAISVNAIVANRVQGKFSADPYAAVDKLIEKTLRSLVS